MAEKKDKKLNAQQAVDAEIEEKEAPSTEQTEEAPEITVDDLIKKLAELKKRADEEKQRADDMTKVAITLRADFDNYRKRSREESAKDKERGNIEVLEKVLPVLDVVEQAIGMIPDENVKKGVEMIKNQMISMLAQFNVEEIESEGKEFDPKLHEAIMQVEGSKEDSGKIQSVFQKGYKIADKIIRPSRVIVFK